MDRTISRSDRPDSVAALARPRLRVLIVDDAPVLRSLFVRIIAGLGHSVVASESDALGALELARVLVPDVLVVDGRLDAAGPCALIRDLRAQVPAARILIVASLEETALVAAVAAAGAAGVVRRPLTRMQIRDALQGLDNAAAGPGP